MYLRVGNIDVINEHELKYSTIWFLITYLNRLFCD